MKKTRILVVAALAVVIGVATQARSAEKEIRRSEVPPAVLRAVQKKYATARMIGFAKENEDGKINYEVTVEDGPRKTDVLLAPDGKILVEEQQIPVSELPEPVKKGIAGSSFARAVVKRVERIVQEEKADNPAYELLVQQGGEQNEVVFDQTGKLTKQTGSKKVEKRDK